MDDIAVPRIEASMTQVFNDRYLASQTPVVLRGAASAWPARERWDRDYLKEVVGPAILHAGVSPTTRHPDLSSPGLVRVEEIDFFSYIDAIWAGDPVASKRFVIGDQAAILKTDGVTPGDPFGRLIRDVVVPPLFERSALRFAGFWLSAGGVVSWLHYDNDGLPHMNAQIKGRKRVVLFSPGQAALLYPRLYTGDDGGLYSQFSDVDVEAPDLDRFPSFTRAQRFVTTLEEGDMLFIPPLWYHSFKHLAPININVNFAFRSARLSLNGVSARNRFWAALRRVLSNGGPLLPARDALAAIAALPPDTRAMLQSLERHVIDPSDAAESGRGEP